MNVLYLLSVEETKKNNYRQRSICLKYVSKTKYSLNSFANHNAQYASTVTGTTSATKYTSAYFSSGTPLKILQLCSMDDNVYLMSSLAIFCHSFPRYLDIMDNQVILLLLLLTKLWLIS